MKTGKHTNDIEIDLEIENFLSSYTIEYPSDEEINRSISIIKTYTPNQKQKTLSIYKSLLTLLKRSGNEIANINKLFWITNLVLYAVGILSVSTMELNPYYTLMCLGPVPFVIGLLEAFKSKEDHVLEIEMSCKYSGQEVIISKLFLIGMYNLLLNTIATLVISAFEPNVIIVKMLFHWITPYTIVMAVSLVIAKRFRSVTAVPVLISIWAVLCMFVLQLTNISTHFQLINPLIYVGIILISVGVVLYEAKQLIVNFKFELVTKYIS